MANKHSSLTLLFTDIANAIRSKSGSTDAIIADDFPSAISALNSSEFTMTKVLDSGDGELTSSPTVPAESTYSATLNHSSDDMAIGDILLVKRTPYGSIMARVKSKGNNNVSAEFPYKSLIVFFNTTTSAISLSRYLNYYKISQ